MSILVECSDSGRSGHKRRADLCRLWIPFGDLALWKIYRYVHSSRFIGVEIDHRRLHPLKRHYGFFGESQGGAGLAVKAGMLPIINEFRQDGGFEWPPLQQNAIGTL